MKPFVERDHRARIRRKPADRSAVIDGHWKNSMAVRLEQVMRFKPQQLVGGRVHRFSAGEVAGECGKLSVCSPGLRFIGSNTNIFNHSQTLMGGLTHSSRFSRMARKIDNISGCASTIV